MTNWDNFGHTEDVSPFQNNHDQNSSAGRRSSDGRTADGLLDPLAFLSFLFKNIGKIMVLTILFSSLGLAAFFSTSFPFRAKAIVLVDPREKGVSITEQVVSNIGGDAAVLESIVQLIESDDFLRPVVKTLDLKQDPDFEKAAASLSIGDPRALVAEFKSRLDVNRLGATYVVEVSFTSSDPEKAAAYANAVANAFINQEQIQRSSANANVATSLSGRLEELKTTLQESEKAVANFRAQNNIINVDAASTLLQRELADLSAQVARAKTNTETVRAQYEQIKGRGSDIFNVLGDQADAATLRNLRQQRDTISQNLAELNLTFGERHPRIAAERSKLDALDIQLNRERLRLTALTKKRVDAAIATQKALERDLASLGERANSTGSALVTLGELERQASANRVLYENFLARFKSADKQNGLQGQEARLASAATPPLKSTKPKLSIAGGVIVIGSMILSLMLVTMHEALRGKGKRDRALPDPRAREMPQEPKPTRKMPFKPHLSADHRHEDIREESVPHQQVEAPAPPLMPSRRQAKPEVVAFAPKQMATFRQRKQAAERQPRPINRASKQAPAAPMHQMRTVSQAQPTPLDVRAMPIAAPASGNGCLGLPVISAQTTNVLEDKLARYLATRNEFNQLLRLNNGPAPIMLVGSWYNGEGKTTFAHALARFMTTHDRSAIVIKTMQNATREIASGRAKGNAAQPFSIFNPKTDYNYGRTIADQPFEAFEAVVEQSRSAFDLVVIDAAAIDQEPGFRKMSARAFSTCVLMDSPRDDQVAALAERTVTSNLTNVDVILNKV